MCPISRSGYGAANNASGADRYGGSSGGLESAQVTTISIKTSRPPSTTSISTAESEDYEGLYYINRVRIFHASMKCAKGTCFYIHTFVISYQIISSFIFVLSIFRFWLISRHIFNLFNPYFHFWVKISLKISKMFLVLKCCVLWLSFTLLHWKCWLQCSICAHASALWL